MFHFIMRTGQEPKKRKVKRGFRTKKEALNFEAEYKRTAKADMDKELFDEAVERYNIGKRKDRQITKLL